MPNDGFTLKTAQNDYSIDEGATWLPLPKSKTLIVPKTSKAYQDNTCIGNDGYTSDLPGLRTVDEIVVPVNYDHDLYAALLALDEADTLVQIRGTMTTHGTQTAGDTWIISAFLTVAVPPVAPGETVMIELSCRVQGAPDYTEGAVA